MSARETKEKRTKVTVESADTACGSVPHMTVDQLAARLNVASKELYCPACGRIHLTEEDVRKAEEIKYSETERFKKISEEAEGSA
jgi:hypothetical protein